MLRKELKKILELHKLWLNDEKGGEIANLNDVDLRYANLSHTELSYADLRHTDLRHADLRYAILSDADLSHANLSNANLSYANLSNTYLRSANLSNAYLNNCIGNGKEIKTINIERYNINYTKERLQIGCKIFTFEQWKDFSDEIIDKMDEDALIWWKKWKDRIFETIKKSPAK